jgi:hypothetical protein
MPSGAEIVGLLFIFGSLVMIQKKVTPESK